MSLETLYGQEPSPTPKSGLRRRIHVPSWLPVLGLVLGFTSILPLVAGDRLFPGPVVDVTPAILFERGVEESPVASTESDPPEILFQASGWIEPEPYPVHVTALQSGVIERVHVLEGQLVEAGQVLVELVHDDIEIEVAKARAKLAEAEAGVRAAEALLARRRDDLARLRRIAGRSVAEQDIVRAEFDVAEQEAIVAAAASSRDLARADLSENELALSRLTITAPISGRVLALRAAPGAKTRLEMDDPFSATVVTLYDPKYLQARVDVPLAQAAGLAVGQRAEITTELLPERTFVGEVTRIVGAADLQRNTLQAKVRLLDTDDMLRPEMLCRAKFFARPVTLDKTLAKASGRRTVMVPGSAVGPDGELWIVSRNERLERRSAQSGAFQREGWVEIKNGLAPGERIVLSRNANLKEGQRVAARLVEDPQP